jgi:hypothetical protein
MKNSENIVMGFWERLPKPFFALAPMADVTDAAFRQIVAKASRHGSQSKKRLRQPLPKSHYDVFTILHYLMLLRQRIYSTLSY